MLIQLEYFLAIPACGVNMAVPQSIDFITKKLLAHNRFTSLKTAVSAITGIPSQRAAQALKRWTGRLLSFALKTGMETHAG